MSLSVLAQAVLVVFGLFLVGLAMVAFAKPAIAERFFTAFASSAATHYTEQALRLLIGAPMIVDALAMWQPAPPRRLDFDSETGGSVRIRRPVR